MALYTSVFWALSLILMWIISCESKIDAIKMENVITDLDIVQKQASEFSVEYEQLERVCVIWVNKKVKGTPKPKNCVEVKDIQSESGVATTYPEDDKPLQVYCDQDTDGGGWTVFQRRYNGSVDFFRNWTEYQNGFGDLDGEFWLGLDALQMLTSRQQHQLRVDLMLWNGTKGSATYSNFSISNSSDNYRLKYASFTGGKAGDSLSVHRGQQFSTKDKDNDKHRTMNCAKERHGAWWYNSCHHSNLNGDYKTSSKAPKKDGLNWRAFGGDIKYSMKFAEMKIRPI